MQLVSVGEAAALLGVAIITLILAGTILTVCPSQHIVDEALARIEAILFE